MKPTGSLRQIAFASISLGNTSFLLLSVYLMYYRIEIQHPIYAILFCDLCFTLALASLDLIALFTNDLDVFIRVSAPSVMFSLYFLSSTWLVVAILR